MLFMIENKSNNMETVEYPPSKNRYDYKML